MLCACGQHRIIWKGVCFYCLDEMHQRRQARLPRWAQRLLDAYERPQLKRAQPKGEPPDVQPAPVDAVRGGVLSVDEVVYPQ